MTLDEKVDKTLVELGVSGASGVAALFAEIRAAMEAERKKLVREGVVGKAEHEMRCKELRDRWLSRKRGILARTDENWLKRAPKDLKPAVGREFNLLRQAAADVEVEKLLLAVPLREAPAHAPDRDAVKAARSEEHTSELQSRLHLVCRLLLEKKKKDKVHVEKVSTRRS